MSGLKVIRRRITSVKNTKQITRAMKLVSAAKLKRAQDAAMSSQVYANKIANILTYVNLELPKNYSNPLQTSKPQVTKKWVIVIAGERGLCGAYNNNLLKSVSQATVSKEQQYQYLAIGKQAENARKRSGWASIETENHENEQCNLGKWIFGEDATKWPVRDMASFFIQEFLKGSFDELEICYTKFVSTMTRKAVVEKLLPFEVMLTEENLDTAQNNPGYLTFKQSRFDPNPTELFQDLLLSLLAIRIQQAGLEAKASEHAARMTAMDAATRNADDLIEKLRLYYNRARQSAITRELIDIVGGAEAIK